MRTFPSLKRMVVKIGTATLSRGGSVDRAFLSDMAKQTARLRSQGLELLLVTSGAIGLGAAEIGLTERPSGVPLRQGLAAVGQPLLMQAWRDAFSTEGIKVAQILVTYDVFSSRTAYLNLRNSVDTLLTLGVLPIFNENDPVSIAEITRAFGDNDRLSALVASRVDADLLILLSDVDALYTTDPRKNPGAARVPEVAVITQELIDNAGGSGTAFATGGMKTKLRAALIAQRAGCATVLVHGREPDILNRVRCGEDVGTHFHAQARLPSRQRWLHQALPAGWMVVDEGALAAMRGHKSLLPKGVRAVDGDFPSGSVVLVNGQVKLRSKYSSEELRKSLGKSLDEVNALLGWKDVIARPEDMAFLDPREQESKP